MRILAPKHTPQEASAKKSFQRGVGPSHSHAFYPSVLQKKPFCPCDGGCPRCHPVVQPKLIIGQPDDVYEQEADRVADMVMRMPAPTVPPKPTSGGSLPSCEEEGEEPLLQTKPLAGKITPLVQRQEVESGEEEREKEEEIPLQAKGEGSRPLEIHPNLESRLRSLQGGGQPLPEATRAFFEPRFGCDFSQVRVHTDGQAAESTQAVKAKAFTVGHDVVFGSGEYAPESTEGKKLLAHELVHAIQQSNENILPDTKASFYSNNMAAAPIRSDSCTNDNADSLAEHKAKSKATSLRNQDHFAITNTYWQPLRVTQRSPLLIQRRILRESYATATYETGPIWDVSLIITNLPEEETEDTQDFVSACMDGIRDAAASLGSGSQVRNRILRIRMRYRKGFDYSAVSNKAFMTARRSVKGITSTTTGRLAPPSPAKQLSLPKEIPKLIQVPVPAKHPSKVPTFPYSSEKGAYPRDVALFTSYLLRGGYIRKVEGLIPATWRAMSDKELTAYLESRFSEDQLKSMYLEKYGERAAIKAKFRKANIVAALVIGLLWARENFAKGEWEKGAAKVGTSTLAAYALNRLLYAHDISAAEKMARCVGEYGRWINGVARTNWKVNLLTRRVGAALLVWDLKDIFMSGGYGGPNIPFDIIEYVDIEDPSTWREPNAKLLDFGFNIWYQQMCTKSHPEACGPEPIYLANIEGSAILGLLKGLDIAPQDIPRFQRNLYRIEGDWDVIDLFFISYPRRHIVASENILVIATGKRSGLLVSGRGHYRSLEVKPVNEAALKLFGSKDPRFVPEYILQPFGR